MLHRRLFCQALVATSVSGAGISAAQTPARVYRLGHLTIGRLDSLPSPPGTDPFKDELARLGLVEGANLVTDLRSARGDPTRLDALAAELVAARPDVLYTSSGFVAARALKTATTTIPIVFAAVGEPVAAGLVASLAQPGGNLTGGSIPVELELKRVQILFEVLGASASIALLTTPVSEGRMARFLVDLAATRLQLRFQEVRKYEDLVPAFEQMARERVGGVAVAQSLLTSSHQSEIAALVLKHRLPAIADGDGYTDDGLMMSYSINWPEVLRKAASYVYKILNGTRPRDLPIEQVASFDFVVNLKAARALGVRIPSSVLVAATRVID